MRWQAGSLLRDSVPDGNLSTRVISDTDGVRALRAEPTCRSIDRVRVYRVASVTTPRCRKKLKEYKAKVRQLLLDLVMRIGSYLIVRRAPHSARFQELNS